MQAGESDAKVMKRLADSEAAFNALTPQAAASQMPRLSAPLVSRRPADGAVCTPRGRRAAPARAGCAPGPAVGFLTSLWP